MKDKSMQECAHVDNSALCGRCSVIPGPLTFDGCGINGGDEYASRIATFASRGDVNAKHYGPLFAAAPALLDALKEEHLGWASKRGDHLEIQKVCLICRLILKAEGEL